MWFIVTTALSTAFAADPFAVETSVHVLDNGLTVVLSEDHNTDNIALHLHYGVGGRDEKPGEFGCAHLFEHLMFEGSKNVPTNAFDEWLTAAGGWNNAFTSEDETAYHMAFPSGALDLALMIESDRMGFLDAGLDQANLSNQQKVVLQERAEGYDEPGGQSWDAMTLVSWPAGHGYQHSVIGTVADIEGFTLDAVVDFWRRYYRPRNATLALVGNFETEQALAAVQHWFGDVPDAGPAPERATAEKPMDPELEKKGRTEIIPDHVLYDKVEDRTLYLAWPSVPRFHPDEAPLTILSNILSNGRGTRLDDALYFKKSVVSDLGAFQSSSEIGGQFLVVAVVDDLPLDKLRAKLDKELAKFAAMPPSDAELDRARKSVRAGVLQSLETIEGRAEGLVDCQRLKGKASCFADDYAPYAAVTAADVMRVYTTYLAPGKARVSLSVVPEGDDGAISGAVSVEVK
jgi:zinc protease